MSIRLNKLLAGRGIGARRKCDTIVAEGRVRVNGRVVTEPGTIVEEDRDRVEVDGRALPGAQKHAYFVINKPVGVITTLADPQGRRTIAEFLPRGQRLFPVGRLDADTSGLLMLTNDGELAHRLMHPRYGVVKVYRVRLDREPANRQLERLARGVEFEPGEVSAPARVRRIDPGFDAIMIEIAIHEGRFRQVRRMCEALGMNVTGLHRVGYGPLRLGPLARGMWRELSDDEVARLRAASSRPQRRPGAPSGGARPARPPRPEAPGRRARPAASEVDIEETWIPGGGTLAAPDDEAGEWPARPGRARGDEDFLAGGEAPRREPAPLPWHAPGYRRGTAAAAERERERAPREREARDRSRPAKPGPGGGAADARRAAPTRGGQADDARRGATAGRQAERGVRGRSEAPRRGPSTGRPGTRGFRDRAEAPRRGPSSGRPESRGFRDRADAPRRGPATGRPETRGFRDRADAPRRGPATGRPETRGFRDRADAPRRGPGRGRPETRSFRDRADAPRRGPATGRPETRGFRDRADAPRRGPAPGSPAARGSRDRADAPRRGPGRGRPETRSFRERADAPRRGPSAARPDGGRSFQGRPDDRRRPGTREERPSGRGRFARAEAPARRRDERSRPPAGGKGRALSPRGERRGGPEGTRPGRGRPAAGGGGRARGPKERGPGRRKR